MKLRINRAWWLRGSGDESYSGLLLPSNGRMCCLGHLGLACGVEPAEMVDVSAPWAGLSLESRNKFPEGMIREGANFYREAPTEVGMALTETNDKKSLTDEEREVKLTKLFKLIGVEVEFHD